MVIKGGSRELAGVKSLTAHRLEPNFKSTLGKTAGWYAESVSVGKALKLPIWCGGGIFVPLV